MCFHPRSDLVLPLLTNDDVKKIVDEWANQITELGKKYLWVQVFENKGSVMGCSNPHPHCQVLAKSHITHTRKHIHPTYSPTCIHKHLYPNTLQHAHIIINQYHCALTHAYVRSRLVQFACLFIGMGLFIYAE